MAASSPVILENEEEYRHKADIQTLLFYNDKVYSGAEDGKIKIWTADLKFIDEIQAHDNCVYSLAAIGNNLYSSANDNTVKCWDINAKVLKRIIHSGGASVSRLFVDGRRLYAGDECGFVAIYENNRLINFLNVVEEVKDIVAAGNIVYTVRNLDVTVTELLKAGDGAFAIKTQIEGASPLAIVNDNLCACSRDVRNITVHKISSTGGLRLLLTIPASEMIINALAAKQQSNDEFILYSGGWDKIIKCWRISDGQLLSSNYSILPGIIYAICIGSDGQAYAGGQSGFICRVEFK